MPGFLKAIWKYLTTKVSVTIAPSSRYKMITFRLRPIVPLLLFVILAGTIGGLVHFFNFYRQNYIVTRDRFEKFKTTSNLEELQAENQQLKRELMTLTHDTQQLRQTLSDLKEYNNQIRNKLDIGSLESEEGKQPQYELTTILSYNQNILRQGLAVGGNEYRLFYTGPRELVKEIQEDLNIIKKEIPEQRQKLSELDGNAEEYNARRAATPSIWPLSDDGEGFISDEFGWRTSPITGEQEFHEGLDIGVWYDTPVLATAKGTVSYAGWLDGYGRIVKIKHGFGYSTYYAHLNSFVVTKGDKVNRGQVIAYSGNSGRSTGPHLHYEVRENNIPRNPRQYIGGN